MRKRPSLPLRALLCLIALAILAPPYTASRLSAGFAEAAPASSEPVYMEVESNRRKDYPWLTEVEFANFRCVVTSGMGEHALYRSSSPVDPMLNRNRQADTAVREAGIRTVLNLSDSRETMEGFKGYYKSYYSKLDVLPLNMSQKWRENSFRKKLAKGLRYMISREGPYLIHCTMGRDRTGFVCAILECLMGASGEEVIDDYMLTYYNFNGIRPGTEIYDATLRRKLTSRLNSALHVSSIRSDRVDLSERARDYLMGIGLSREEISALKDRLGSDYP